MSKQHTKLNDIFSLSDPQLFSRKPQPSHDLATHSTTSRSIYKSERVLSRPSTSNTKPNDIPEDGIFHNIKNDVCLPIDVEFLNIIILSSESVTNGQEILEYSHFKIPSKLQDIKDK